MTNTAKTDVEKISERFLAFAEFECKGNSTLYYQLSNQIAEDSEILAMASATRIGQPIPNIFLAAVHFLLLKNNEQALATFYPSISKQKTSEIPFQLFKNFCLDNEKDIVDIIATKIVQTNVINRCSYLMPIFSKIMNDENRPTTIIDIGTSAGLTLNFDKYEYWYNDKKIFGNSKVVNSSKIISAEIPTIYPIKQKISKIGIDQNIIDTTNKDELLWLQSLIWPDQLDRFGYMEEALKLEHLNEINFCKGQSIKEFEEIILNVDKDQALIIYATHTLYQFSQAHKDEFYSMIERIGKERDLYFLSVEGIKSLLEKYNSTETVIALTTYKNKEKMETFIAETNGHGNWINWK
jgi:hypothetical protein